MTFFGDALIIPLVLLIIGLAGWLMALIDSVAQPPGHTRGEQPPAPRRDLIPLDAPGNQRELEAAPHRGRLVAWGGSIFGGKR